MVKSVTRLFNAVGRLFNSSAKKTTQVEIAVKGTTGNFNRATHTGYLEREFFLNGEWRMVRTEYRTLADGSKVSATKVFPKINGKYEFGAGAISRNRTRTVNIEQSILGGKRITISKVDAETMGYAGRQSTFVKDYDDAGILWHKTYSSMNSNGFTKTATADRMYETMPFNSGVDDMLVNPSQVNNFKLSNNFGNNYNNFIEEGSMYSKALEAQKLAKAEALAVAEAQKATELAAREAEALALAASRPRVNVGAVFPQYNIDDLKVVEKIAENGKITRYYFRPETGAGNRIPIIKTTDYKGIHCEWINGSNKADKIFFKQVGQNSPYIFAKNGNSTFVRQAKSSANGEQHNLIEQFYLNGVNKAHNVAYTSSNLSPELVQYNRLPSVETTILNPRYGRSGGYCPEPKEITWSRHGNISNKAFDLEAYGFRGNGYSVEEYDDVNRILTDIRTKSLDEWDEFANVDRFFLPFS